MIQMTHPIKPGLLGQLKDAHRVRTWEDVADRIGASRRTVNQVRESGRASIGFAAQVCKEFGLGWDDVLAPPMGVEDSLAEQSVSPARETSAA